MLEPFNHMMDEANALSHQLFDGALPDALDYTGEVGYVKRVDGQRIVSSERQGKANDLKQTINISDIDTEQEDTDPQHRDVEDNGGQRSQVAESEMGTDRGKGSNADNQNTGEIEGAPKESEDVRGDGEEGVSKSAQESSESKEMSSESKETSSESKEMSSESKETSSESKEMSNESKEMSNESKGAPNESKETSSESKGAPSESKETSSESRETSSESKEMSSESKETSSESKETSSESKDMPSKGESASSKSKGASDDTVSDYGSNNDNNGAEAEAALKGQHDKLHENERESHDEDLGTTVSL
ncbi:hypothetical protein SARC_10334 [Sphaeroforma arctica JP610]|uniref:Uncharacterized protein n=1 Tax=Sphaeroforma arctica JP610 TaxID=667725 RepID=A0A0L0FKA0_9EUKA|nr:hypothetical protein SARC_10334 [Sphaeroforma arctica JP610]KNC77199.1 hypothetical protein SARC_10334 [Sphaeroforma arctica JP610]|eukprot:XP_014151101.1 hypothetical protein SARC_10334 [Sphaeroforma arctica JP610]